MVDVAVVTVVTVVVGVDVAVVGVGVGSHSWSGNRSIDGSYTGKRRICDTNGFRHIALRGVLTGETEKLSWGFFGELVARDALVPRGGDLEAMIRAMCARKKFQ